MTVRTRRALNRVRNHARSLVRAVDALKPADVACLSWWTRYALGRARSEANAISDKLTDLLDFGDVRGALKAVRAIEAKTITSNCTTIVDPITVTGSDAPTLASVGDYRADDQADEARDVAREMAAREDAS